MQHCIYELKIIVRPEQTRSSGSKILKNIKATKNFKLVDEVLVYQISPLFSSCVLNAYQSSNDHVSAELRN